jgi:hypothetical protein
VPACRGWFPLTGKAIADSHLLSVEENIGWKSNLGQGQAIVTWGGLRAFDRARFKVEDYSEGSWSVCDVCVKIADVRDLLKF